MTWYRIAYLAHTRPGLARGLPAAAKLLKYDLAALDALVRLNIDSLIACGASASIPSFFTYHEDAIEDARWKERFLAIKAEFYVFRTGNHAPAVAMIESSPVFATTKSETILLCWLIAAPLEIKLERSFTIIARLRRASKTAAVILHCDLVESALRSTDENQIGSAVDILRTGLARYKDTLRGTKPSDVFGSFKLFQSTLLLGQLTRDRSILENSIVCGQDCLRISKGRLDGNIATVLTGCGEAAFFLKQHDRAIGFFEAATAEDSRDYLARIFYARALLDLDEIEKARTCIVDVSEKLKLPENKLDLAFVAASLALKTRDVTDMEFAKRTLVSAGSGFGVFELWRQSYLSDLNSLPASAPPQEPLWRTILTKYLLLEPNVMGLGVNLNAIIADATASHQNQERSGAK